jgi:hypothetical protein
MRNGQRIRLVAFGALLLVTTAAVAAKVWMSRTGLRLGDGGTPEVSNIEPLYIGLEIGRLEVTSAQAGRRLADLQASLWRPGAQPIEVFSPAFKVVDGRPKSILWCYLYTSPEARSWLGVCTAEGRIVRTARGTLAAPTSGDVRSLGTWSFDTDDFNMQLVALGTPPGRTAWVQRTIHVRQDHAGSRNRSVLLTPVLFDPVSGAARQIQDPPAADDEQIHSELLALYNAAQVSRVTWDGSVTESSGRPVEMYSINVRAVPDGEAQRILLETKLTDEKVIWIQEQAGRTVERSEQGTFVIDVVQGRLSVGFYRTGERGLIQVRTLTRFAS